MAATDDDVPSPIDFTELREASAWEQSAPARPGRTEIFATIARELTALPDVARVLELGSGPGFLAAVLLDARPRLNLTLLDFSAAMHGLARARLGHRSEGVMFVERSFKEPGWASGLGPFDAVVTNQAVHELRHKRHAPALHRAVRGILAPGGVYLVSDHVFGEGGLPDERMYMTEPEHREALLAAGFGSVEKILRRGSLVLHRARA